MRKYRKSKGTAHGWGIRFGAVLLCAFMWLTAGATFAQRREDSWATTGQALVAGAVRQAPFAAADAFSTNGPQVFDSRAEQAVIHAVNEERARLGLVPVRYSEDLARAARVRSQEMLSAEVFSHRRPDGSRFETALDAQGISYTIAGENIAYYQGVGSKLGDGAYWFTQWKESRKHYENMLRPAFTEMGVGICYEYRNGTYTIYATQLLAGDEELTMSLL